MRILGSLGATEVDGIGDGHARLHRLVTGAASDLGTEVPTVWVFGGTHMNALVTMIGSRPALAVGEDFAAACTLTELEAVVAHCMLRARDGVVRPTLARRLEGWSKRLPACSPASYDAHAAALTRYPTGLASAIRKARPRADKARGLWFVPAADGDCAPVARVARLEDL
jgi:hypothetical protein